ncbi:MAG: flagellar basal body P-ring protein FlgI [Thermodesulfobacteria bacterium]|nr:flagellar basal body P-ring protein FlgI [Thermodesulfobacteriota bacterium]
MKKKMLGKNSFLGKIILAVCSCCILFMHCGFCEAARLKDIASVQGLRENQLVGYGLVVGLAGTGDGTQVKFTTKSIRNIMERMGIISIDPNQVKVKNVAAVIVTAKMPPLAKIGQKIDVVVSSLGDAKSLLGGTLILTPLKGVDGKIYALAQGPVSVGGYAAGGAGASVQKNHPTAGRIPNGATVEREIPVDLMDKKELKINLFQPDFTTVGRAVDAINDVLGAQFAKAIDAETIALRVPPEFEDSPVSLLATIENVEISPDTKARVVLDERTGTVVMGKNVQISTVAVAHGNLSIQIKESPQVSQPGPFSPQGQTVVTPGTEAKVSEGGGKLVVLRQGSTIGELVSALNAVGVTPRDLITIMQSIKAAGALQADLQVI